MINRASIILCISRLFIVFFVSFVDLLPSPSDYVALYEFQDNLDDSSANSFHGTCDGSITFVTDRHGNANSAAYFDGTYCVDQGNQIPELRSSEVSVCLWFITESTAVHNVLVSSRSGGYQASTHNGIFLRSQGYYDSGPLDRTRVDFYPSIAPVDDRWHHMCITNDGITAKLFYDGALVGSDAGGDGTLYYSTGGTSNNWIGCRNCENGQGLCANTFTGALDDVTFYDRALTFAEVLQHYGAMSSYEFDGNIQDSGINGRHGTVHTGSSAGYSRNRFGIPRSSAIYVAPYKVVIQPTGVGPLAPPNGPFSFSGWFRTTGQGVNWMQVMKQFNSGWSVGMGTHTVPVPFQAKIDCGSMWLVTNIKTHYSLVDDEWHFFAFSTDGFDANAWVDGAYIDSDSGGSGSYEYGTGEFFLSGNVDTYRGKLDEFRFYNRLLTDEEVKMEYQKYLCAVHPCGEDYEWIVAYFPFNAYPSYGFIGDAAGKHGIVATVTGATVTNDRFGHPNSAYYFDGSSNINIGSNSALYPTDQFSVSLWFRATDYSVLGDMELISSSQSGDVNDVGYRLYITRRNLVRCSFRNQASGSLIETEFEFKWDTEWHHVVCKTDGVTISLDFDLSEVGEKIDVMTAIEYPVQDGVVIGTDFVGDIDDVTLYDAFISSLELRSLYGYFTYVHMLGATSDSAVNHCYYRLSALSMTTGSGVTKTSDMFGVADFAMNFDGGVNSYIDVGKSLVTSPKNAVSITAWIKHTNTDGLDHVIVGRSPGGYSLYHNDKTLHCSVESPSTNVIVASVTTTSLDDGNWHHVGCVLDVVGQSVKVYYDGALAREEIGGGDGSIYYEDNANEFFMIGAEDDSGTKAFLGDMTHVFVAHKIMTDEEMFAEYKKHQQLLPSDFVAFYPLFRVTDSSPNEIDGTVYFNNMKTYDRYGSITMAHKFDGGSALNLGTDVALLKDSAMSVCLWMKTTSRNRQVLVRSGNDGFVLGTCDAKICARVHILSDEEIDLYSKRARPVINNGMWHHVCLTSDGTDASIYVDGVMHDTGTSLGGGIKYTTGDTWIGANSCNPNCDDLPFTGAMSDLVFYNRELSYDEVLSNYGASSKYMFDGDTTDSGRNSLDATIFGSNGGSELFERDRWGSPEAAAVYQGVCCGSAQGYSLRLYANSHPFTLSPASGYFGYSGWFSTDPSYAGGYALMNTNSGGWRVEFTRSPQRLMMRTQTTTGDLQFDSTPSYQLDDERFHHFMYVTDGFKARAWLDGVSYGEISGGSGTFAYGINGAFIGVANFPTECTLDDITFYDRMLSQDDASAQYMSYLCNTLMCRGIVAYYPFDGNAADRSGETAYDGTVKNGATLTADRFGTADSAYEFSDATNHIVIGSPSDALFPIAELSLSVWYKLDDPAVSPGGDLINSGTATPGYRLWISGTGVLTCSVQSYPSNSNVETQHDLSAFMQHDTNWHHVVCVFDGTDMKLFVDSELVDTATGGEGLISYPVLSSLTLGSPSNSIIGAIDDVGIYNMQINEVFNTLDDLERNEIEALYGLIADYPLDEAVYYQSKGYWGLDGTVNGVANIVQTSNMFGVSNRAVDFNVGNGASIDLGTNLKFFPTDGITLSAWIRTPNADGSSRVIVKGPGGYKLFKVGETINCEFYTAPGSPILASFTPRDLCDDNWHHVACVIDGTTVTLFYDGENVKETTGGSGSIYYDQGLTRTTIIGATDVAVGDGWFGMIDDLFFYHNVMSHSQVLKLYGVIEWFKFTSGSLFGESLNIELIKVAGNPLLSNDMYGADSALSFAVGDVLAVKSGQEARLRPTINEFGLSVWFKTSDTNNGGTLVVHNTPGYKIKFNSGQIECSFNTGVGVQVLLSHTPSNLYDGKWHLVACSSNGVNSNLFFDGIEVDTDGSGAGGFLYPSENGVKIGGDGFVGDISEVKFFERSITQFDVNVMWGERITGELTHTGTLTTAPFLCPGVCLEPTTGAKLSICLSRTQDDPYLCTKLLPGEGDITQDFNGKDHYVKIGEYPVPWFVIAFWGNDGWCGWPIMFDNVKVQDHGPAGMCDMSLFPGNTKPTLDLNGGEAIARKYKYDATINRYVLFEIYSPVAGGWTDVLGSPFTIDCVSYAPACRSMFNQCIDPNAVSDVGWNTFDHVCGVCNDGLYFDYDATMQCTCLADTYFNEGKTECLDCPSYTFTNGVSGRTSVDECICMEDSYGDLGGPNCQSCPLRSSTLGAIGQSSIDACVCEEGYEKFGSKCRATFYCGAFLADENLVCSGRGSCIYVSPGIGECQGCEIPFYGEFCEVYECGGITMDSASVCNGNGKLPDYPEDWPCKFTEQKPREFYCECLQDEVLGFYDSSSDCLSCSPGYYPDCIKPKCDNTRGLYDIPTDSCICYQSPEEGYFEGPGCGRCSEGYYGTISPEDAGQPDDVNQCRVFCECVKDGVESGTCSQEGDSCECFFDFERGWFGDNFCSSCLQTNTHKIQGQGCLHGFYDPGNWFIPSELGKIEVLFFNEYFDTLWGYFTTDVEKSGLCEDIGFPAENMRSWCYYRIFRDSKLKVFGAPERFEADEFVSYIEIKGFIGLKPGMKLDLDLGAIGGQGTKRRSFSTTEVDIERFSLEHNTLSIAYDAPKPIFKSFITEKSFSMCEFADREIIVQAMNGDESTTDLGFSFSSSHPAMQTYLESTLLSNPSGESIIWHNMSTLLIIPAEHFNSDDTQSVFTEFTFVIKNYYDQTIEKTLIIETTNDENYLSLRIPGTKFFSFTTTDVNYAMGTLPLQLYLCNTPHQPLNPGGKGVEIIMQPNDNGIEPTLDSGFVTIPMPEQDRIDFFTGAFLQYNVEHKMKVQITVPGFTDPVSDEVIVLPKTRPLVIEIPTTTLQSHINRDIIIDARSSFDPDHIEGEESFVQWECHDACTGFIEKIDTNEDFHVKIPGGSFTKGGMKEIWIKWNKGFREASMPIYVNVSDSEKEFLFKANVGGKKFCKEGSDFLNEFFHFRGTKKFNFKDYRYYYENNLVDLTVSLSNTNCSMSVNFFELEYAQQPEPPHMAPFSFFENDMGTLTVMHDEEGEGLHTLKLHYKYFKKCLFAGTDNMFFVKVEVQTDDEYIAGQTATNFKVHPKKTSFLKVEKYPSEDINVPKYPVGCSGDTEERTKRIYTRFRFNDNFKVEYRSKRFAKTELKAMGRNAGGKFAYSYVPEIQEVRRIVEQSAPHVSFVYANALPYRVEDGVCEGGRRNKGEKFVKAEVDRMNLLIEESITLIDSNGCAADLEDPLDKSLNNDLWMYKGEYDTESGDERRVIVEYVEYSSDGNTRRHQLENEEAGLSFLTQPPFDVTPKTNAQKMALKAMEISDLELLWQEEVTDEMIIELYDIFDIYKTLSETNPETPNVNIYSTELIIQDVFTRILYADTSVLDVAVVKDKLWVVIGILTRMMDYHAEHVSLGLFPNSNLQFVFRVIENINFVAFSYPSEENFDAIVRDVKVLRKVFQNIMIESNIDSYDTQLEFANVEQRQTLNLFHSKLIDENTVNSLKDDQFQIQMDRTEATKFLVGKSDFNNGFDIVGDEKQDLVMSEFVQVQTNNDMKNVKKDFGVFFSMGDKLANSNLDERRMAGLTIYVRPYCYSNSEEVGWNSEGSGKQCIGLSDFFHKDSGNVFCAYEGVDINSEFVVIVEEYPGCVKRVFCPLETICSEFIRLNVQELQSSGSARARLTFSSILQSGGGGSEVRREEGAGIEDKTIRSVCMNEYNGFIIDSAYDLWIFGSSEHNDYLPEDSQLPVKISTLTPEWTGYTPRIVKCTKSSAFVLAHKPPNYQDTKLFAFGRNENFELGEGMEKFTKFEEVIASNVFDVQTSPQAVYVTRTEPYSGRSTVKIDVQGHNAFGELGSGSSAERSYGWESIDPTNLPDAPENPKITPLENGVFITYEFVVEETNETVTEYYFSGKGHPGTGENVGIPTKFDLDKKVDFVQRLFGSSCLYIISEGKFFVGGGAACASSEYGIRANDVHDDVLHEFTNYQYGEQFDHKENLVFDFVCAYACYVVAKKRGEKGEVNTFVFGRIDDGIGFSAQCFNNNCDQLTLASTDVIGVVPGMGSTLVDHENGGELMENFDVLYFNKPEMGLNVLKKNEISDFPPEIVFEESGLSNNVFSLTFRKPFVFGETDSSIRFVRAEEHPEYETYVAENEYMYPYFKDSLWTMENVEIDGESFDYYRISDTWENIRLENKWANPENGVYTHRVLFGEHFYMGVEYGEILHRSDYFTFDFEVIFPRVLLKTSFSAQQNGDEYWNFFITQKGFDRTTRRGTIEFSAVLKNPNYFVFFDNVGETIIPSHLQATFPETRIGDLVPEDSRLYFENVEVTEVGIESQASRREVTCNQNDCYQSFVLSFEIMGDRRVCEVPKSSIPVNFIQFCLDESHEDCVLENQVVPFTVELEIKDLCEGYFQESIETEMTLGVYSDWTFQNEFEEDHTFRINDWIYVRTQVESTEVTVTEVNFHKVYFADELLYSEVSGISEEGTIVGFVIDEISSSSIGETGFHLKIDNRLTKLQPGINSQFDLVVILSVLYLGNDHSVDSERDYPRRVASFGAYYKESSITIVVAQTEEGSPFFEVFPLLFMVCLTVIAVLFAAVCCAAVTVTFLRGSPRTTITRERKSVLP